VSTAPLDRRTPAIAGAAQTLQRPDELADLSDARGPIELMVDAARLAAEDAGSARLLERVGWVGVTAGLWSFKNPGQLVAERIGSPDAATCVSSISGTAPQELVGLAAECIRRGDIEVALVVGGEAAWSTARLRRAGQERPWLDTPGEGVPELLAGLPDATLQEAGELGSAAVFYALFEDGLRIARGDSVNDHRDRIASLWAEFGAVAADNPFAWDQSGPSREQIRDATPDNRMIAFPYPKALVANNTVNLASAVLLCSAQSAKDAGVSSDRLVFPLVSTTSHETWQVINRDVLHEAPALTAAGQAALDHVGVEAGQIDHVDLYACFPSIVQMSAAALGLVGRRQLTLTGGLGFAGAAIANSSGHALASLVPLLRNGGLGLVHANGGFATKHAFGLYANDPVVSFHRFDCQDQIDLRPRPAVGPDWSGAGSVEASTVVFDREGPTHVLAAVRTTDGSRAFVRSSDRDLMDLAMSEGLGGLRAPL
jgi:acetyl-CoA C-acetyltransferase